MNIHNEIEAGYVEQVGSSLGWGCGWSWHELAVFRRIHDGKLAWDEESGCSCRGFLEYATFNDLQPLPETLADFESAVRDFDDSDPASKVELLALVNQMLKL